MADPLNIGQRQAVARTACGRLHIDFPAVVDTMDDRASRAYNALPDRIYVIRSDGAIGFRSAPGAGGFDPDALARYLNRWVGAPSSRSRAILAQSTPQSHNAPSTISLAGRPAPAVEGASITGQPVSLAALRGKVVLLDFWATWCPPCRAALPNLLRLYHRYHAQGLEIVGISLDGEAAGTGSRQVRQLARKMAIPWPQLCDGRAFDGPAALSYGVDDSPTTVLIGTDGSVRMVQHGALSYSRLEEAVAAALSGDRLARAQ